DQANVTLYDATAVAAVTLEAFAGMWINAFIVSVICMAWVKKKVLNSTDKILLFLGCSRFWHLCIGWTYYFLSIIYPKYFHVHPVFPLFDSVQSILNCSNFWVSTCLCVFYCIKIANFRNSFFMYLKVKIDRIVLWFLLVAVLFSLVIGIVVYDITETALCKSFNSTTQGILWKSSIRVNEHFFPSYFIIGFVFGTSFMTVVFSALLLLSSLWRHKRNMQRNSMKDLSMDAHIRAMKSILSLFVLYNINLICFILTIVYAVKGQNHVMFLISVFMYAFPGVHSLILIFSNPKLEKTMLRMLACVKCKVCMKQ
ncbi:TA2R9 protein, partial [Scytalopus superciliaris]|nr:TA2R9 protein [Scytalopus superciliaris]